MLPDDIHLRLVEALHLVRGEAEIVDQMARGRFFHEVVGQIHLVEAVVVHAPERGAPGTVHRLDRAVAGGEPFAEGKPCLVRIAVDRVMVAVFVVRLPGVHEGIFAVAAHHGVGDAGGFDAVAAAGETVVPAGAELAHDAALVDGQYIRVTVDQPLRRCGGRRTKDDLEAGAAEHVDRLVHPFPLEDAGLRLDMRPGEFADTHPGKAKLHHAAGVLVPFLARPLLRIIADASSSMPASCRLASKRFCLVSGLCTGIVLVTNTVQCKRLYCTLNFGLAALSGRARQAFHRGRRGSGRNPQRRTAPAGLTFSTLWCGPSLESRMRCLRFISAMMKSIPLPAGSSVSRSRTSSMPLKRP